MRSTFSNIAFFAVLSGVALLAGCGARVNSSTGNGTMVIEARSRDDAARFALVELHDRVRMLHDVYAAFGKLHNEARFRDAEADTGEQLARLEHQLRTRGEPEPEAAAKAGRFADPAVQADFNRLLAAGKESSAAALRAAAHEEETHIALLRERRHETGELDIQEACQRLEREARFRRFSFVAGLRILGLSDVAEVEAPAQR